jgi:hypothetical protein
VASLYVQEALSEDARALMKLDDKEFFNNDVVRDTAGVVLLIGALTCVRWSPWSCSTHTTSTTSVLLARSSTSATVSP